jgi:hypothetical protein
MCQETGCPAGTNHPAAIDNACAFCQTFSEVHALTEPSGRRYEERRDSIGSIRLRWKPIYSVLFVIQALPAMAYISWAELAWITDDSPVDTLKAILWGVALAGGAAIATTGTLAEVQDIMLGTRDMINDWLQKRREKLEAKLTEQGRAEGRAELQAKVRAWYERQQAALDKGEPFDEPLPLEDEH